jgi:ribonuclease P protein component
MKLATLKVRSEFLAVRGGGRWAGPAFVLEGRRRMPDAGASDTPRIGFTVTKKLGNAVVRNRMRRRLREAARSVMPEFAQPGFDYVLIAREAALVRPFNDLQRDLAQAFRRVHQGPRGRKS